jgi:hypothetical protein
VQATSMKIVSSFLLRLMPTGTVCGPDCESIWPSSQTRHQLHRRRPVVLVRAPSRGASVSNPARSGWTR